eukprot:2759576-Amphidinium_carterae.1
MDHDDQTRPARDCERVSVSENATPFPTHAHISKLGKTVSPSCHQHDCSNAGPHVLTPAFWTKVHLKHVPVIDIDHP